MNIARERCWWSVDVHVGINLKHKKKIGDILRITQVLINTLKHIQQSPYIHHLWKYLPRYTLFVPPSPSPQKSCIGIVFNFSRDHCNTQEKLNVHNMHCVKV